MNEIEDWKVGTRFEFPKESEPNYGCVNSKLFVVVHLNPTLKYDQIHWRGIECEGCEPAEGDCEVTWCNGWTIEHFEALNPIIIEQRREYLLANRIRDAISEAENF